MNKITINGYYLPRLSVDIDKEFIRDLMILTDEEKEYKPELLFDDQRIIQRLEKHPMALWKMKL